MLLDKGDHLGTVEGKQVLKRARRYEAERTLCKCTMENLQDDRPGQQRVIVYKNGDSVVSRKEILLSRLSVAKPIVDEEITLAEVMKVVIALLQEPSAFPDNLSSSD